MKTLTILLASLSCCLSAAPAFAANNREPLTVTGNQTEDPDTIRVSYRDLRLANAADAGVLRARVKQAAMRRCDALYGSSFLPMLWGCRDAAWRAAAPQIAAAIERAKAGQNLAAGNEVVRFVLR